MVRPFKYNENNEPSELNDDEYNALLETGWTPGPEKDWTLEQALNPPAPVNTPLADYQPLPSAE
jgi:hypothetical protein